MEHISEVTLLLVSVVNIIVIITSCAVNTATEKISKRVRTTVTISLMLLNILFNTVCQILFMVNGEKDSCKIFVLFIPITYMILYAEIRKMKISK